MSVVVVVTVAAAISPVIPISVACSTASVTFWSRHRGSDGGGCWGGVASSIHFRADFFAVKFCCFAIVFFFNVDVFGDAILSEK